MKASVERAWMTVPGIREGGDRTIEEQLLGLGDAMRRAKGKTVLDMGCAEGAISRAFAEAGATSVHGQELLSGHLDVACRYCAGVRNVSFEHIDYRIYLPNTVRATRATAFPVYDIVLALAIVHKLARPEIPLVFAARSARELLVLRPPRFERKGMFTSKRGENLVSFVEVLRDEGFVIDHIDTGPREERTWYWVRK